MLPPVLRSMIVSASYFTAISAFLTSSSSAGKSIEVPMLTLTFVLSFLPMPT